MVVSSSTRPPGRASSTTGSRQKTETSPGYFEGEKRGYATGGSISARWGMSNDHLFSVEAPRFKVGCGGIDLFMGRLFVPERELPRAEVPEDPPGRPRHGLRPRLEHALPAVLEHHEVPGGPRERAQRPPDERLPRREGAFGEDRVALHRQPEDQGRGAAGLLPRDGDYTTSTTTFNRRSSRTAGSPRYRTRRPCTAAVPPR